ncbi:MAG: hypothetical protein VCC04_00845 [Myxococcota bacterium]
MSRSDERDPQSLCQAVPPRLEELGLGPDSILMNEPKIFRERTFLSLLLAELEDKLGPEQSRRALFQIGTRHGMRDARSTWQAPAACEADRKATPPGGFPPSLSMRLFGQSRDEGGFEIRGSWPDAHEAGARLDRLGGSEHPSCFLSLGYTSGWLSETRGHDFVVTEEECSAAKGQGCRFRAVEAQTTDSIGESAGPTDPDATRGVPALAPSTTPDRIDQRDAIHIWGPVMVLPCSRPRDALATLKQLQEDASLRDVRVVVVDLLNTVVAPGCAKDPVEDLLDAIESWGAETVLTGLCRPTRATLSPLQRPVLIGPNGLPEAIAMAFQVAEAGRHLI